VPSCEIILRTAVNAGGFAQSFGRLRLALSAPRTARGASGKHKPHPPQNLAQTHPAQLPFLGLTRNGTILLHCLRAYMHDFTCTTLLSALCSGHHFFIGHALPASADGLTAFHQAATPHTLPMFHRYDTRIAEHTRNHRRVPVAHRAARLSHTTSRLLVCLLVAPRRRRCPRCPPTSLLFPFQRLLLPFPRKTPANFLVRNRPPKKQQPSNNPITALTHNTYESC
jgi:hypothetical protein